MNKLSLFRHYMYNQIYTVFENAKIEGDILGIDKIENFNHIINFKKSRLVNVFYPDQDIQNLTYDDESFDCIISDQVLEHIKEPHKAISESYRILRKGGIAIHTTCFVNFYHPAPIDFFRFSPDCLEYLFKEYSNIIQVGGWGNKIAIFLSMISDRFRNLKVPDHKLSLRNYIANKNNDQYPIVSWIVAKK